MLNEEKIKELAQDLQFDACGVIAVSTVNNDCLNSFNNWLQKGYHAEMSYMERYFDKRCAPKDLLAEGAKTIVVTLYSYHTKDSETAPKTGIARYAKGIDYHSVLKRKLQQLYSALQKEQTSLKARTFVDTAPIQERYWAAQAGLGWIGKNGMLINQKLGSYTFIGIMLLNEAVEHL
ncbi:MAG: epoxyqueuosine reductase, partial [Bacteroidales bacterium]